MSTSSPSATATYVNRPGYLLILARDGFIDRYSGEQLLFPPVLRILSHVLPEEFPFYPNWKMTECHQAYWELWATVDHVVPIAAGGSNEETNLVSTSMVLNAAKANWTLKELGWTLHPPGDLDTWDGLVGWFFEYVQTNEELLQDTSVRRWHAAALKARAGYYQ